MLEGAAGQGPHVENHQSRILKLLNTYHTEFVSVFSHKCGTVAAVTETKNNRSGAPGDPQKYRPFLKHNYQ